MQSDYVCLNTKTFEIEKDKYVSVDKQLARAVATLSKKGYAVEMFSRARISKTFLIGAVIHDLIEENLLTINEQTKDKIKKIIKNSDLESNLITFQKKHKFESLPKGYQLIDDGIGITYYLETLKDTENLELKTLLELDEEHQESIRNLEVWAESLPDVEQ